MIDARILDNHSIYNVAFALTEFKTLAFYDTVRAVRKIAYDRVVDLPTETPLILTNAHATDSDWGNESWDEAIALARRTGRSHHVVVLECSREENARRIQGLDREERRKPRDPAMFRQTPEDRELMSRDAAALLRLDVTHLTADQSAKKIADWLKVTGQP